MQRNTGCEHRINSEAVKAVKVKKTSMLKASKMLNVPIAALNITCMILVSTESVV